MKTMKGWRTITFNVVMALILLLENYAGLWNIPSGIAESIIVIGNIALRFLTDTPVGESE